MSKEHIYNLTLDWTGNKGLGTKGYRSYERSHIIQINGKPDILASSDPSFLGDPTKHNPEELLLSSLSSCHMLWYLHLCSDEGIIVLEYHDSATGKMTETEHGGGKFLSVTLSPNVIIEDDSLIEKANILHKKANELCFIANSVNFPVHHKPMCTSKNESK